MDKEGAQKLVEYWLKAAEYDRPMVLVTFQNKRYVESLYFGHLILEKVLKAHVVRKLGEEAPKIHNLV